MRQQVERWRAQQLSEEEAKLTIYRAFIEGDLDVPKHLARRVHELYFNPQHEEFDREPSGACQTRLRLHSRNWTRFRSLRRLPNWVGSWRAVLRVILAYGAVSPCARSR